MPHWRATCLESDNKIPLGYDPKVGGMARKWTVGLRNIHHKLGCRETAYAPSNEVDVNERIKYEIFLLKSEEMVERRDVFSKFL